MEKITPKIIRIDSSQLTLDNKNPRLPESITGKNQKEVFKFMKESYNLEELALSMTNNGYFEAEPLVVIPTKNIEKINEYNEYIKNPNNNYIVVEGNRRLSTIIGLLENIFIDIGITEDLKEQFKNLPVLVYPSREKVVGFLGVHHLAGVRKWNVYERARYIVHLKRDLYYSIDDIQKIIGDRKNSAKKTYVCYRLLEIVQEYNENFNLKDAKANFSFLQLATGQNGIKEFIGLRVWNEINDLDKPIPKNKYKNLEFLFQCLFDSNYGNRLIKESREITSKLSDIFEDEQATEYLRKYKNIETAYYMIGGELIFLNNLAGEIRKDLEAMVGKLSSIKISEIKESEEMNNKFINFKVNISAIKRLVSNIAITKEV